MSGLTIEGLVGSLELEPTGPDTYVAPNVDSGHGVVFGGQLMGQSIVAGLAGLEGMAAKTLHIVFARGARPDAPVEIAVDRMHAGRTFASTTVTISQGDRLCTRALVLAHADDEPDLIRHADRPSTLVAPDDCPPMGEDGSAWQIRSVGDVDINDPDKVGPADLDVWTRFVGAPEDPAVNQALLAYATDGFLIATAMRPHPGVGQALAHVTLSTGVISHTLTFHEPVAAGQWTLLAHHSPYAGHGRAYGRADVFDSAGDLVASFVQDAMIRSMGDRAPGRL